MADDEQPKKKSKLVLLLIVFMVLIILGGGGGAAWYFLVYNKSANKDAAPVATTAPLGKGETPSTGFNATLPTFLVNLSDPLGKRFIKLTLELEVANPTVLQEITKNQSRIQDSLIMLLSSKTYSDLLPMEGKMTLKNEILSRINQILGGSKVVRVFFTDLVIQ